MKFESSYLDNSKTQMFSLLFCTVLNEDELLIGVSDSNEVKNDLTKHIENIGLTNDVIDKMKLSELKETLGARNLTKNHVNAVIVIRLKQIIANKLAIVDSTNQNITPNMVGQNF